jgi:hypothetical protein
MHDVLALEERGVPTVLLCTEPFMDAARHHAAALGCPDYQAVRVGHPLASLAPEGARARADEALARVVELLTAGGTRTTGPGAQPLPPADAPGRG